MDELLRVLWAYKTTSRKLTGVSPFALTYGMEAIIPIEMGVLTLRTKIPEKANIEASAKELDIADELHEVAAIHMASFQQRITNLYNRRVR